MGFLGSPSALAFVVVLVSFSVRTAAGEELFPAMYVFGDSLIDNGNNNYLDSLAKSNYIPYGIDFDGGRPTGRFSNGKTIIDFLGELLGLPIIPAFMETETGETDITKGVNYASAAGGILDETGRNLGDRFSFNRQVQNFERNVAQMKEIMEEMEVTEHLAKSLAVVSIGNNDYINNYLKPSFPTRSMYNPTDFADILISNYTAKLLELYGLGLRKFVLAAVGPLGCIPNQLATGGAPPGKCVEAVNDMAQMFNQRLRSLVDRLNAKRTADNIFVYGNTYGAFIDILTQPAAYGFGMTDKACCGIGRNRGQITCLPLSIPCADRDGHVFWDAFHPTQAFNQIIAVRAFNGSPSDCYPININQMSHL